MITSISSTSYAMHGHIAVVTLNNPPINGLGQTRRSGIVAALDQALADPLVLAIVLTSSEAAFSGGAEMREFGTPKAGHEPMLGTVIRAVEQSVKPVVAALAGVCLDGGLELALSCHFCVAKPDASLGTPEVKLGLMSGTGGIQRLPRLIGLDWAKNMIVSGQPEAAARFEGT